MKASFAIAAAVTPQGRPVAKPDHTGAFRTAFSSLLPSPTQSAMHAVIPGSTGDPGGETSEVAAGTSDLGAGGTNLKTDQGDPHLCVGQSQPGVEERPSKNITGALPNQLAKLLSPARNVPTVSTAKTERARYTPQDEADAANVGGARPHSSPSQGASDQPPGSGVSVPLSLPALSSLHSSELKATPQPAAQRIGAQSSQSQILAKALVPAVPSQLQTPAGPAPPASYAAYVPHSAGASSGSSRDTTESSPGYPGSQTSLPESGPLASHNLGVRTAVAVSPTSQASHNDAPQIVAAAKPPKVSQTVDRQDHAAERLRVAPPITPHGTLAPQMKEISIPGAPSKINELAITPPSGLHPTAEFSRPTGAPVTSQGAETTVSRVLQRMDTAVSGQNLSLRADSRHLDVGVQSPTFGWIEVRTSSGGSGSVDATIHVQSDAFARNIADHSDHIIAYAREHSVGVGQLSVGVGGGEGGRQEHGHRQQAAGEQERNEQEVPPLAVPGDAPSGLSLISIRA